MAFNFIPEAGLLNHTSFPTNPATEDAARQQFQTLLDQLKDYINANLINTLMPIGSIICYGTNTVITGYLKCNGQAVSRETYNPLFLVIGNAFGNGDGSTTFNLPDIRGRFIRGFDDGRGLDVGRTTYGSTQEDENKAHYHQEKVGWGAVGGLNAVQEKWATTDNLTSIYTASAGGTESRPKNIALTYLIKY